MTRIIIHFVLFADSIIPAFTMFPPAPGPCKLEPIFVNQSSRHTVTFRVDKHLLKATILASTKFSRSYFFQELATIKFSG